MRTHTHTRTGNNLHSTWQEQSAAKVRISLQARSEVSQPRLRHPPSGFAAWASASVQGWPGVLLHTSLFLRQEARDSISATSLSPACENGHGQLCLGFQKCTHVFARDVDEYALTLRPGTYHMAVHVFAGECMIHAEGIPWAEIS